MKIGNLNNVDNGYNKEYGIEYRVGFMEGYNCNIMIEGPVESIPLNEEELYLLGYRDGQNYAEYCKMAGIDKDVKPESLEGQIDRTFSQSYLIFKDYEKNYSDYKQGFLDGRYQYLQNVLYGGSDISAILDVDEENFKLLGRYDGYASCMETNGKDCIVGRAKDEELEPFIKESFRKRKAIQEHEKKI